MLTDPSTLLLQLARALDTAEIPYVIGGSIASSRHGEYRATNDIDVLIDAGPASLTALFDALGSSFHLDREASPFGLRDLLAQALKDAGLAG